MVNLTNSSARTSIEVADASQIASMANGGQNVLSTQDMQVLGNSGWCSTACGGGRATSTAAS